MNSAVESGGRRRSVHPWPLVFLGGSPHAKFAVAGGVGVALAAYFGISGTWLPDSYPDHWNSSRQITGMAITFTLLLSYLSGFFLYAAEKTGEFVEELRPLFTGAEAESLVAELNRVEPWRYLAATLAGVVLGCFNISWDVALELGSSSHWPIDLAMVTGSMSVWILAAQVIYSRAHNAALLTRLGRDAIAVDLFRPHRLQAFARIGVLDVLVVAGALALTPFQSLDAEFRSFNYSFAFLVGLPAGIFLLMSPMWGIRQNLAAAKSRALAEVDSLIAAASRATDDSAVSRLNALVARRTTLEGVHTWPIDTRGMSRVGLYFIIPPLAWVGAALVEMFVEWMVHSF